MSDFSDLTPEMRWYIAHTYSGYENKVMANLEKIIENRGLKDVITDIRVPVRKILSGGPEEVAADTASVEDGEVEAAVESEKKYTEEKIFPCYVFVKMIMNDETWHIVRNIRGVTGFVGPGSKPVPLTDAEVASIGMLEDLSVIELKYKVGDSVKITAGFLKDYVGTVKEISEDKKKIKVIASMFGRETPFELDSDSVEPI